MKKDKSKVANKQRTIKVRHSVGKDGTKKKSSVGVSKGGRICTTERTSKRLNKAGDYEVTEKRTYRKPTPAVLNNLKKQGIDYKLK